jgi:hypothetical protein
LEEDKDWNNQIKEIAGYAYKQSDRVALGMNILHFYG